MTKEVVVRKATAKDISSIVELWKELMDFNKQHDEHWSRFESGHENFAYFLNSHVADDTFCILVAEMDKDIIGYCLSEIRKCEPQFFETQEYGHISNLAVTENYRSKGIGTKLFRETVIWFSQQGIHRIETCVSTSNDLSKEYWARMGFTPYLETVFLEI